MLDLPIADVYDSKANEIYKTILQVMSDALQKGEMIHIQGFGTFKPVRRKGYTGTVHYKYKGKVISQPFIRPDRTEIRFTPTRALRKFVNLPLQEKEENAS